MPVRPQKRGGAALRARAPMKPRPPASVELATVEDHSLEDEATYRRLDFAIDLSGRAAESVGFEQCRFRNVDLGGTSLVKAAFTDCLFENGNLANLRVERSSMLRVRLSVLRMTGVHWIDGSLRDVAVSECRADLTSLRFSDFHNVTFEGCNLTRADFQNADVSGVQFTNCDLSGAQFSQAKMEPISRAPGGRYVLLVGSCVDLGWCSEEFEDLPLERGLPHPSLAGRPPRPPHRNQALPTHQRIS